MFIIDYCYNLIIFFKLCGDKYVLRQFYNLRQKRKRINTTAKSIASSVINYCVYSFLRMCYGKWSYWLHKPINNTDGQIVTISLICIAAILNTSRPPSLNDFINNV